MKKLMNFLTRKTDQMYLTVKPTCGKCRYHQFRYHQFLNIDAYSDDLCFRNGNVVFDPVSGFWFQPVLCEVANKDGQCKCSRFKDHWWSTTDMFHAKEEVKKARWQGTDWKPE